MANSLALCIVCHIKGVLVAATLRLWTGSLTVPMEVDLVPCGSWRWGPFGNKLSVVLRACMGTEAATTCKVSPPGARDCRTATIPCHVHAAEVRNFMAGRMARTQSCESCAQVTDVGYQVHYHVLM